MNRIKSAIAAATLVVLAIAPALAAPTVYKIDPVHSSVGFTVRHIVSRVPGRFTEFSGEITVDKESPEASKVTAEIDAKSMNTANPKRDDHLKSPDFLDVEKYPKVTFVSTSAKSTGKDKTTVTGDLTLHGVTKPVTLDVTWLGFMGPKAGFEARTTINRKDFGIVWNRALDQGGMMLGDEVDVVLLIEATDVAAIPPRPAEKPANKPAGTQPAAPK